MKYLQILSVIHLHYHVDTFTPTFHTRISGCHRKISPGVNGSRYSATVAWFLRQLPAQPKRIFRCAGQSLESEVLENHNMSPLSHLPHRPTLLGSLLERPGCSGLCFCFFFFFSFFFFFLSLSSSFFFFLCFFSCMSVPSAEPSCVGVSPGRYLLCLRWRRCLRPGGWFMKRYCSGKGPGWRRKAASCVTQTQV